ncbi:hypothetical protein GW916_11030 [bacterium]|nr:hypothetical protein [bacterium]
MRNQFESVLNQFNSKKKNRVLSAFHEWKSVDHSFEEIRVLLKNSRKALEKQGVESHVIDEILSDGKVDGSELNLNEEIKLSERYVALYFDQGKVVPQNISLAVKSEGLIGDVPFILPLLFRKSGANMMALVVNERECAAHAISSTNATEFHFENMPHSLSETLDKYLVSDKLDFNLGDDSLDRSNLELSEGSLEDKRKRMAHDALSAILPKLSRDTLLMVMASNRMIGHIREDLKAHKSTIKCAVEVMEFVPTGANVAERNESLLRKARQFYVNYDDPMVATPEFEREPLRDIERGLSVLMSGQGESMHLDEGMMRFHLESMERGEELLTLNNWIVENVDALPKINVAPNLGSPMAVIPFETLGDHDLVLSEDSKIKKTSASIKTLWSSYMEPNIQ